MQQHGERGSFTIETLLALPIFMFAFITIASLAAVARAESVVQHAITQTAKEISLYYYIPAKLGVVGGDDNSGQKDTDDLIDAVMAFTDSAKSAVSTENIDGALAGNLSGLQGGYDQVKAAGENLYANLKTYGSNPKAIVKALTKLFMDGALNETVSRVVAQPLCKMLAEQYITATGGSDSLTKMGIVKGFDGLDFTMSSFLRDGRSINVVVTYQIKVNGFTFFDQTLNIKQAASTAAWTKTASLKEAKEKKEAQTKWDLDSNGQHLDRGKLFVEELRKESAATAVALGDGYDFYDSNTNELKELYSINVFSKSYSTYSGNGDSASDYTLNFASKLNEYASSLEKNANALKKKDSIGKYDSNETILVNKTGDPSLVLWIVIPEEAANHPDLKKMEDALKKTHPNVTIQWDPREKALKPPPEPVVVPITKEGE